MLGCGIGEGGKYLDSLIKSFMFEPLEWKNILTGRSLSLLGTSTKSGWINQILDNRI